MGHQIGRPGTAARSSSRRQRATWLAASTPVRITADYAYFRLRDEGYTSEDVKKWADTLAAETARCRDVFVYFDNDVKVRAPFDARNLARLLAGKAAEPLPPSLATVTEQPRTSWAAWERIATR